MEGGGRRSCKSKVRIDQVTNIFSTIFALKPKQMLSNALQQLHRNLYIDYNWFPPYSPSIQNCYCEAQLLYCCLRCLLCQWQVWICADCASCVYCYSNLPIQVFNLYGAI